MSITLLIIVFTAFTSIMAFSREDIMNRLVFNPWKVVKRNEYFRIITHGAIHADWMHLMINMFVLYSFGEAVELYYFPVLLPENSRLMFSLLYFGGLIAASVPALLTKSNNPDYNAVGASGAVSAVTFAAIVCNPYGEILLFLIPVPIPAWIFGILYLIYSAVMARRGKDGIAHDAHFAGSVFGIAFMFIARPELLYYYLGLLS
jgi:membrane associated rhomboid family serine protease